MSSGNALRIGATFVALMGFAAIGMGGCGSSGNDPYPPSHYDPPPRYDDHPRSGYDDHGRADEPRKRASGIPDDARLGNEGKGRIAFRAPRDGRVFIEDTHDLRLLVVAELFEGEEIYVDPGRDRILIGDQRLRGDEKRPQKLIDDHRHRIYFDRNHDEHPHHGPSFDRDRERDVRY
jgi:hypothetical protein